MTCLLVYNQDNRSRMGMWIYNQAKGLDISPIGCVYKENYN